MALAGVPLHGLLQALSHLSLDETAANSDTSQSTPPSNRVYSSEPASHFSDSTVDTSNLQTPHSDHSHDAVTLGTVDGKAELDRRLESLASSALVPSRIQTAALQPRASSSDEHLADDEDDADDGASIMSGASAQIEGVDEKLRLLQDQFGTLDYLPMEERFLSEAQSALVSNVLVVGRSFVTSHRFAFYAIIPPIEEDMAAQRANIIRQGPVVTAIPVRGADTAALTAKNYKGKRIWAVLTRDDFSLHASNKVRMPDAATLHSAVCI